MRSYLSPTISIRPYLFLFVVCGLASSHSLTAICAYAQKKAAPMQTGKMKTAPINLMPCIGKGFPEYAKIIGKPGSVENDDRNKGQSRVYMSPELAKKGVARINLSSYPLIEGKPDAVTFIQIVFKKGTELSWQKAMDFVGITRTNVNAIEQTVYLNGKQSVAQVVLEGVSIPGVSVAAVERGTVAELDRGYGFSWYPAHPSFDDAPVLEIHYNSSGLYIPVKLKPWAIYSAEGAEGKLETLPDGSIKITTVKTGKNAWSNGAWVSSSEVFDNNTYVITFEAKADEPRDIWLFAELNEKPYSPVGLDEKNVHLSTEYQKFSYSFRPKGAEDKSVKIPNFFVGDRLGSIYIRNINVKVKTGGR